MKKIIFVCYGGGHVAMVEPVVSMLLSSKSYDVTVLALTTAYEKLKKTGVKIIGYKDLVHLVQCSNWKDYGVKLVGRDESYSSPISYEESVAYHGINFLDLVDKHGEESAYALFKNEGRHSFYPLAFMERFLCEYKPDLVVSTNAPRSERAVIEAAGKINIPSVCMVDLFAMEEYRWISRKHFASRVFVLNESVRQRFLSLGRKEHEIIVTGNPAFDSIFSQETLDRSKSLTESKYTHEFLNILYASQPEPEKHPFNNKYGDAQLPRKIENTLRDFVEANNEYRLVLRYHPSETNSFTPGTRVLYSPKDENLHALIHCMDLVIVTASTVGLEAYLANKTVVSVDSSIFTSDAPFSSMGISHGVRDETYLPKKINALMKNLVRSSDVRPGSVNATKKVICEIEKIMQYV